mmetsp:Transcript_43419/g.94543  ORF Transcript_43419/g.94543 Transcript_43419/m.94543 type:complete len:338 (-) Transcript_43419:58-1071(-)
MRGSLGPRPGQDRCLGRCLGRWAINLPRIVAPTPWLSPARGSRGSDEPAQEREDAEGDSHVEGYPDQTWPSPRVEEHDAIRLHDLHHAVKSPLVHLLRVFALHPRLHRVLRHSEEDGHSPGAGASSPVEEGIVTLHWVVSGHEAHEEELRRKADHLIGTLLGDGGDHAPVETHWAFVLEDLHDGVGRTRVVLGSPAHVVRHARLDRLHGRDSQHRLRDTATEAGKHPRRHGNVALLVLELISHVRIARPPRGLLEGGPDDQRQGAAIKTHWPIRLHRLDAAVQNARVLGRFLRLELELSLDELRRVADDCLNAASQEALDQCPHGRLAGILLHAPHS